MRRRVRVIGCGNPDAGDDALGLEAIRRLRDRIPEDVEAIEAGPATRVLDLLQGAEVVFVIDAIRTTGGSRAAGTLVRAEGDRLGAELHSSLSSHGFGLAESVGLAAALGDAPRVVFHGIEAADVAIGAPISDAVAASLPGLVDAVLADVAEAMAP